MDPRPGLKLIQPITMRPETRPNLKPGGESIPSGLLIHLYGKKKKSIYMIIINKKCAYFVITPMKDGGSNVKRWQFHSRNSAL
jgi:hypothetical protein